MASPAVRCALVVRAAEMLARRELVTLRALVAGTGASTMAVYTHFGSMPGLWRAVRQEGFTRLSQHLATVETTRDPVRDLAALGAAYVSNALGHPDLYRTMFDAGFDLEDPEEADRTFEVLVSCAARAQELGRFGEHVDPEAVATQFWAMGHGITMLVLTGVLPRRALVDHVPSMTTALFVAAGDREDRCQRSVHRGWRTLESAALTETERTGDRNVDLPGPDGR